jgi:DNA-binding transcriptional regulator YiaG
MTPSIRFSPSVSFSNLFFLVIAFFSVVTRLDQHTLREVPLLRSIRHTYKQQPLSLAFPCPSGLLRAKVQRQEGSTAMNHVRLMTAAQFRVLREYLGFTGDALALHLCVTSRSVRAWEQGKYPVPAEVCAAMENLVADTARAVTHLVDALADTAAPAVTVYHNDAEYQAMVPGATMPAAWHRVVVARAAERAPGLLITFPNEHVSEDAADEQMRDQLDQKHQQQEPT